jgi:hypothetical protein
MPVPRPISLFALLIPAVLAAASVRGGEVPVFSRDIAPILRSHCAGCHNDTDLEGDFSLETYALLRKGGEKGDLVAPGKPEESLMVRLIEGRGKPKMPPKDEPQVAAEDLAVLKRWIASGAPGPAEDHSLFESLEVPAARPSASPQPLTAAAFSPDGQWLALAREKLVEIRRAATGEIRKTLTALPGRANAVHFSPDGRKLAAASGIAGLSGAAWIWEWETENPPRKFGGHRDVLYDAELSPDGALLATAGYDRIIRLWNAADGKLLRSIDVHKGAIFDLAWHPSGKILASASADETVKLWRVADGVRLDTLNQPQGEQRSVFFSADGAFVLSAGADKRIHLWKLVSRDAPALNPLVHSRFAHESGIAALAVSSDGKTVFSSADDRTLKAWSLPDLQQMHAFDLQSDVTPVLAAQPKSSSLFLGRMDGSSQTVALPDNLPSPTAAAAPPASPPDAPAPPSAPPAAEIAEAEPDNDAAQAMKVSWPSRIQGAVAQPGDIDLFRFTARRGQTVALEVTAARNKSQLDSRIEILRADGSLLEQVVLQATRDSWLTFRGKDSETSDDFRVHNWAQMELNEYLFCNGEVVKLWHYPRGPDSGFRVYPGRGRRQTYFFTSAHAHALGQPCYTVTPFPPESQPAPNGLPVFRLHWENDDDPSGRSGSDSLLLFTAPHDGEFLAKVSDVRGFGAPQEFHYTLTLRPPNPDFSVAVDGANPKVSPGSGKEITFNLTRFDGFDGPVRIDIANLPAGFSSNAPLTVESGQTQALAVIFADATAANPNADADKAVTLTATATLNGTEVKKSIGNLGDIQLGEQAKVTVAILPSGSAATPPTPPEQPVRLTIRRGQTISARVRAQRRDFAGRIELGGDDAGRNLPHAVFVDNIGLNGLLIVEGQTEREFQITASPVAAPGQRQFFLRTTADGGQASRPAIIEVVP